ncbi:hypothetical protein DEF24_26930, partial [Marinitenerispora sediminis]
PESAPDPRPDPDDVPDPGPSGDGPTTSSLGRDEPDDLPEHSPTRDTPEQAPDDTPTPEGSPTPTPSPAGNTGPDSTARPIRDDASDDVPTGAGDDVGDDIPLLGVRERETPIDNPDGAITPDFNRDMAAIFGNNGNQILAPWRNDVGWLDPKTARQFRDDMGDLFERQFSTTLGRDAARQLGSDYADTFAKNWGKPELRNSLDDLLANQPTPLPQSTRDFLSGGVTDTLTKTLNEFGSRWRDRFQQLGFAMGSGAIEGYVGEGLTNLLFSPEQEWKANGMSAVAGAASGGLQTLATMGGVAAINSLKNMGPIT